VTAAAPPSGLRLRRALPSDVPVILQLVRELAEYERAPGEVVASEADLLRDGFGAGPPRFFVELAECDGQVAGFALWFFNYSTWQGRAGLYLEDLFVRPALRGRGIGKALLVHLARTAVAEGCGRFVWQVLDWNAPAIAFYEALGARPLREWVTMRVTDEALAKLAAADR
jgi:GNAT superfamily N-acetyltransferase